MLNRSINDTATSDPLVEFITLTAKTVALNPTSPELDSLLRAFIESCIANGQDDILVSALRQSEGLHVFSILNERIVSLAERIRVRLPSMPNAEAIVFAIPMVIEPHHGKALPKRIEDPERIRLLLQSHRLINDRQALAIHDELFTLEDINWLPSQIRQINQQLIEQAEGEISISESRRSFVMKPSESPEGDLILRFLVGVVISDQALTPLFCEQPKSDAFGGFAEEWSVAFEDEMDEQTGHPVWAVEKPNPLSIAASRGIHLLNGLDIFYKVIMKDQDYPVSKVLLSKHGVDGIPTEIRAAFFDDDKALSTVYVWPLLTTDDAKTEFEDINELLIDLNIPHMIDNNLLPAIEFTGSFQHYCESMSRQLEPEEPQTFFIC
ncbi:hypothetical protein [Methylomonas fluvii]|uniref:DUF1822 family protein n=1 Tax=Methylomonas fluvii TaxID=1854564 RepID=A0ABR9D7A9_9GAMM|nr:hypothetical protein [Methylomonas fluvii]MBD9358996.1 hypothetical protein [Methylomonas fluvii]CAD6871663.1 hypothetical protein [Methylomonas fluvii]